MENAVPIIIVIGLVIVSLAFLNYWVATRNGFICARNKVRENLKVLGTQIEEFNDLLELMITSTRQAAGEENNLYRKLAQDRRKLMDLTPDPLPQSFDHDSSAGMNQLFLQTAAKANTAARFVMENYPTYQSTALYANAQNKLTKSRENITAAKRMLAAAEALYNDSVETFPNSIVAGVHEFRPLPQPASEADLPSQRSTTWS